MVIVMGDQHVCSEGIRCEIYCPALVQRMFLQLSEPPRQMLWAKNDDREYDVFNSCAQVQLQLCRCMGVAAMDHSRSHAP